jgi:arylsulfatase A-like enzyme
VPGVTKPKTTSNRPIDFMSIYPTLAELSGLPIPPHVEGASIRKLLADSAASWDRPALTTHGYRNHAVRTADWRYIRYADGGEELYDERNDPYEWRNLAGDKTHDALKARLATAFPTVNKPDPRRTGSSGGKVTEAPKSR